MQKNVFGLQLKACNNALLTGFYRDGCCNTGADDIGVHTVCIIENQDFLEFSLMVGNDLSTPQLRYEFPGLKPGDHWCLCAERWKEALMNNMAPDVILEATNEKTLDIISLKLLLPFAYKEKEG
jgi:uncharacterized protein (DUF2237 family)